MAATEVMTHRRRSAPGRWGWRIGPVVGALLVALPVLVVFSFWFVPVESDWTHIRETVLGEYIRNSLGLFVIVGLLTSLIGATTAYLIATYEFPGRGALEWLLILPLALPTYIAAFAYLGLLDYAGPVQTGIRELFGFETVRDYWFPRVASMPGVAVVMSLVLYPYVYLLARPVMSNQVQELHETARTFGWRGIGLFRRVALPLSRPAIAAGAGLAVMEALGDFGSVSFYGVPTFTTGIYRTWLNMGDLPGAARLASLLLIFILAAILIERWSRRRMPVETANQRIEARRQGLTGWRALAAFVVCLLPPLLGFALPVYQLGTWAVDHLEVLRSGEFYAMATRTAGLALGVALFLVAFGFLLRYGQRVVSSRLIEGSNRLASLGYAVPGSVVAVGVLIPLAGLDRFLDARFESWFGISLGLVFSGTILALAYAYFVRFLAVAYGAADGGLGRLSRQLDHAALTLGCGPVRSLFLIHLPLMRGTLLGAAVLVMVDIMKELPATLILRPFNFETLATYTYALATEERLPEAAVYALAIVALGVVPVVILTRLMKTGEAKPAE